MAKRGFEKIGLTCCPKSSGRMSVYSGSSKPKSVARSIYGATPKATMPKNAKTLAGTRKTNILGAG